MVGAKSQDLSPYDAILLYVVFAKKTVTWANAHKREKQIGRITTDSPDYLLLLGQWKELSTGTVQTFENLNNSFHKICYDCIPSCTSL